MDIDPGVRIEDTSGVISDSSQVEQAIDQLAQDHSANLYVVTLDRFEDPSQAQAWVQTLASTNNMGSNDLVLAIATQERTAYFMAGSTGLL